MNYYLIKKKFSCYKFDKNIGYTMSPNLKYSNPNKPPLNAPRKIIFVDLRTDQNGFLFTDNLETEKKNNKIIFCLGGSTTAGFECAHDRHYPAQLDTLIKPRGYRCVNAGLGGARSIHELLLLKYKLLPHKPHAIILFSGYNDYESFGYKIHQPYNPYVHYLSNVINNNQIVDLLDYSVIFHEIKKKLYQFRFNLVRKTFYKKKNRRSEVKKEKSSMWDLDDLTWLNEWKNNVNDMIQICKKNQIKFFILNTISPVYKKAGNDAKLFSDIDLQMDGRFDKWVEFLDLIEENYQSICKNNNVSFLDVNPFFEEYLSDYHGEDYYKKRFSLFTDRMHFSELGNKLLANAIYQLIDNEL
tara:strand:+ start:16455 stop:17522 length:1068 start_codon:yes stop_codon:yes gene_type:complete